jgi:hypothetical protein
LNTQTTHRIQGDHFSIVSGRLNFLAMRSQLPVTTVTELALDYDWPNADDHQTWLDTAPTAEIVGWLHEVSDAYALTQVMPERR